MTDEQEKHQEHKKEEHVERKEHIEHKEHEKKSEEVKVNLTRLGKNKKEVLENISFIIIVISSILFAVGIGIGSFIQGTIFLSVIGSFFVMVGIVTYIASQFLEV
jgi:predicted phage tail protein